VAKTSLISTSTLILLVFASRVALQMPLSHYQNQYSAGIRTNFSKDPLPAELEALNFS
jgi:hypothetical protein